MSTSVSDQQDRLDDTDPQFEDFQEEGQDSAENAGSPQTDDDEPDVDPGQDSEADASKASSGRRRARSSKVSRKQVQSILDMRAQVEAASGEVREITAAVLGADEASDVDVLTVSVVTADASANRALESLTRLASTEEQLERVVDVSSWSKTTRTTAWKLLHELSLVARQQPSNEAKAAAAIAKAVDDLPDVLTEVSALIGR